MKSSEVHYKCNFFESKLNIHTSHASIDVVRCIEAISYLRFFYKYLFQKKKGEKIDI